MTTLAIRDGIVAFDSRLTEGGMITPDLVSKAIVSPKHHVIYAGVGTISTWLSLTRYLDGLPFLPWQGGGWNSTDTPDLGDDTGLLVVDKEGSVYTFEYQSWYKSVGPFHAAGTGSMAAYAAMYMKASAKRAVEIAIKLDSKSGPPVRVLKVADIP